MCQSLFFNKVAACNKKRDSGTGVFLWYLQKTASVDKIQLHIINPLFPRKEHLLIDKINESKAFYWVFSWEWDPPGKKLNKEVYKNQFQNSVVI